MPGRRRRVSKQALPPRRGIVYNSPVCFVPGCVCGAPRTRTVFRRSERLADELGRAGRLCHPRARRSGHRQDCTVAGVLPSPEGRAPSAVGCVRCAVHAAAARPAARYRASDPGQVARCRQCRDESRRHLHRSARRTRARAAGADRVRGLSLGRRSDIRPAQVPRSPHAAHALDAGDDVSHRRGRLPPSVPFRDRRPAVLDRAPPAAAAAVGGRSREAGEAGGTFLARTVQNDRRQSVLRH